MAAALTVAAGADFTTTSSLLSWLIYGLVTYPGMQERLVQELVNHDFKDDVDVTPELIEELTELDKYVKVSLRSVSCTCEHVTNHHITGDATQAQSFVPTRPYSSKGSDPTWRSQNAQGRRHHRGSPSHPQQSQSLGEPRSFRSRPLGLRVRQETRQNRLYPVRVTHYLCLCYTEPLAIALPPDSACVSASTLRSKKSRSSSPSWSGGMNGSKVWPAHWESKDHHANLTTRRRKR